jgi:hypothetical protein
MKKNDLKRLSAVLTNQMERRAVYKSFVHSCAESPRWPRQTLSKVLRSPGGGGDMEKHGEDILQRFITKFHHTFMITAHTVKMNMRMAKGR